MERDSTQEQYEEMTQTPVPKLVLRLAVPTTISMLVTSIYNMADTLFVSQLGTSVSSATGVVFALMAVINAFGFMFGHGAGSNISRKLGAHGPCVCFHQLLFSVLSRRLHWNIRTFISCSIYAAFGKHRFYFALCA